MDQQVAEVFNLTASQLGDLGGILEVTGANPDVADRLGLPPVSNRATAYALPTPVSHPVGGT